MYSIVLLFKWHSSKMNVTGDAKVKAEISKSNIFINKKARDFVFVYFVKNLLINKINFLNKLKTPC